MCEFSERMMREGERKAKIKVAEAMKADKKPIDEIIKYSGLSKEEIEAL